MISKKAICKMAYIFGDDLAIKYASKYNVDDFDTFKFLVYLHKINSLKIDELEERINELEQKQKAHNNA